MVGRYYIAVLFQIAWVFQRCYCASLTLHNLENSLNTDGENLLLDLEFDDDDVDIWDIEESYPCILINGATCKCLQDTLQFADFKADTKECLASHNLTFAVWVSIQLRVSPDAGDARFITSLPVNVGGGNDLKLEGFTLLLPLTRNDVARSTVLFQSLSSIVDSTMVHKMLVFAPDSHVEFLSHQLKSRIDNLPFKVSIYPESTLFQNPAVLKSSYPYSIQMAIKLLASKLVETDFYMTLDADVILLRSFSIKDVLSIPKSSNGHRNNHGVGARALYHRESRLVHPAWWHGSAAFLDMHRDTPSIKLDGVVLHRPGFGVTPALLSTYGSLLAVSYIEELAAKKSKHRKRAISAEEGCATALDESLHPDNDASAPREHDGHDNTDQETKDRSQEYNSQPDYEAFWLQSFGVDGQLWSEYTIYRLVLDHYGLFRKLHVPEFRRYHLHCHDVWFAEDLQWNRTSAELSDYCLFSVVQSSTGADVDHLLQKTRIVL
jgi:hypothetical protein